MMEQQCLLSGMYTDDWFVIGAAQFVAMEPGRFTDATRATLSPFSEELSLDEKLHLLAVNGGQFLVADTFEPNGGRGIKP